ncbi:hypothetical protein P8452_33862 [Trifolium repens]|nr:hypothetical protein P8452_33862 [Trifolium repens]
MASKSTIKLLTFFYFMLFSFIQLSSTVLSMSSTHHTSHMQWFHRYISEGALKRDKPVCNGGAGGEAYSKSEGCIPPPSHPYNRGCSKYYRCRSDS